MEWYIVELGEYGNDLEWEFMVKAACLDYAVEYARQCYPDCKMFVYLYRGE